MDSRTAWLVNGTVLTPRGPVRATVGWREGRIVAVGPARTKGGRAIDVDGRYVAPGLIDLHVWGAPALLAREAAKGGATGFLASIEPCAPARLLERLEALSKSVDAGRETPDPGSARGALCLGVHLEGPFLNPARGGALPKRWMRAPTVAELRTLERVAGLIRVVTLAPELPGAFGAIQWCRRHRIAVSLGHSDADGQTARLAAQAGASLVTHLFNGMRPFHHRDAGLAGVALTDRRLAAMVILDGAHVSPAAFQIALRCKGVAGVILVTDSIRFQDPRPAVTHRQGVFRTARGVLAGSGLTMIEAVRNAVKFAKIPLSDAVQMASLNPARAIGAEALLGSLDIGKRADLVVFDRDFRVTMTVVDGRIVYPRAVRESR